MKTYTTFYKMSDNQAEPSVDYAYSEREMFESHRRITRMGGRIISVQED